MTEGPEGMEEGGEPAAGHDGPQVAAYRLDIPCGQAGFTPPPVPVHLTFLPLGDRWTLLALATAGRVGEVAAWLQQYRPVSIEIAPGLAPKMLRAAFEQLPPAWERLLSEVAVRYMELSPEGPASLFVTGSRARVERVVETGRAGAAKGRVRKRLAPGERVELTPRQLEAVTLAVALGYYELPHTLNLRAFAAKMGLSVGAASELLRRAERLIVTGYLDKLAEARWESVKDTTSAQPRDRQRGL